MHVNRHGTRARYVELLRERQLVLKFNELWFHNSNPNRANREAMKLPFHLSGAALGHSWPPWRSCTLQFDCIAD